MISDTDKENEKVLCICRTRGPLRNRSTTKCVICGCSPGTKGEGFITKELAVIVDICGEYTSFEQLVVNVARLMIENTSMFNMSAVFVMTGLLNREELSDVLPEDTTEELTKVTSNYIKKLEDTWTP